jgi:hypothetical protein
MKRSRPKPAPTRVGETDRATDPSPTTAVLHQADRTEAPEPASIRRRNGGSASRIARP